MLCSSNILFCNSTPSSNGRDSFYFMRFQPTFMLRTNNLSFCNPVPFSNERVFIYLYIFNFSTLTLCASNILLCISLPFWNSFILYVINLYQHHAVLEQHVILYFYTIYKREGLLYFIHTLLPHLQVAPLQHIIFNPVPFSNGRDFFYFIRIQLFHLHVVHQQHIIL